MAVTREIILLSRLSKIDVSTNGPEMKRQTDLSIGGQVSGNSAFYGTKFEIFRPCVIMHICLVAVIFVKQ